MKSSIKISNGMDKATARPWRVAELCENSLYIRPENQGFILATIPMGATETHPGSHTANAALIVKAVNSFEALNAVAEALKEQVKSLLGYNDPFKWAEQYRSNPQINKTLLRAVDALANLEAVRKEGK